MSTEFVLKNVRLSYPQLLTPQAFKGKGEPRYSASFLLAKDDAQVKKLIVPALSEAAIAKWGDKGMQMVKQLQAKDMIALHDGDLKLDKEGAPQGGYGEHFYLSAAAQKDKAPRVLTRGGDIITVETSGLYPNDVPYGGCFVHARVNIWAQDNDYGCRLNAGLLAVVFASDGDPFGSVVATEQGTLDAFAAAGIAFDSPAAPSGGNGATDPADQNGGGDDEVESLFG